MGRSCFWSGGGKEGRKGGRGGEKSGEEWRSLWMRRRGGVKVVLGEEGGGREGIEEVVASMLVGACKKMVERRGCVGGRVKA